VHERDLPGQTRARARIDQVGDAVKAALGAGVPAIIEIPIDPDEFPTPAAAVRRPD